MADPLPRDLRALPKVELHVHLEGSMRAATLLELSERDGRPPPPGLDPDGYRFADFGEFLRAYAFACACLRTPSDFRRVAAELVADLAAQGVRYAEATFTPVGHAMRLEGLGWRRPWEEPLEEVLAGLRDGEREHGTVVRLVLDHARELPPDGAERLVPVAAAYRDEGVIGFGLGGDERFGPEAFAGAFRRAREHGLHALPHAGEAAGPESIRGALDLLGAERIGHGIRCLEDPSLVDRLRAQRIPLEVCPTSNVATGVVRSIEEHALPHLLALGLEVTLNSDDPAMFSADLVDQYLLAHERFGLGDEAIADLARAAVRASFAGDTLKRSIIDAIDRWLAVAAEPSPLSPPPLDDPH